MERVIKQYLKDAHQLTAQEEVLEDNDLVLLYKFTGGAIPGFTITVDTQAVNEDDDGTVRERAVTAQIFTGVKVPDEKTAAVLEVMSRFARDSWFFSGYIDEDSEVALQWNVNVMAQGLHTEYVYDMLARLCKTWEKLSPLLATALQ
ncbi:MAG: YbjN domain-containing protein [Armatimonadetes bacterium]|nr:YbjN domain-containing protein [Armatimonadota bacterium]